MTVKTFGDDERPGRAAVNCKSSSTSIKTALEGDGRQTVREISEVTDVSRRTVHRVLFDELNMKKRTFDSTFDIIKVYFVSILTNITSIAYKI